MSALCLMAGATWVALGSSLTLSWTHSIQKTLWEEDFEARNGQLVLVEARFRGTGAGMEPSPDAIWTGQFWRDRPNRALPEVKLQHSPYTATYTLCTQEKCQVLTQWLPQLAAIDTVTLLPCSSTPATPPR